jgi:hypothetical protein
MRDRRAQVERLIGTTLPQEADDLHHAIVRPSSQLAFYTAYVRFGASHDDYVALMRRMAMDFVSDGGAANRHLPTAWRSPSDPSWWDPGDETPPDAAAKTLAYNGWAVAKYERGRVYLILTETGMPSCG